MISEKEYSHYDSLTILDCAADPQYFIENYITVDSRKITLSSDQINFIKCIDDNDCEYGILPKFAGRHCGRTSVIAYLSVWLLLFTSSTTVIAANSGIARDHVVSIIHSAIEQLPSCFPHITWSSAGKTFSTEHNSHLRISLIDKNCNALRGLTISHLFADGLSESKIESINRNWGPVGCSTGSTFAII